MPFSLFKVQFYTYFDLSLRNSRCNFVVENGEGKSKFTNLLTKYVFVNSFFFLENEADQKNKCFSYEHKVL